MYCSSCGQRNDDGVLVCTACGRPLRGPAQGGGLGGTASAGAPPQALERPTGITLLAILDIALGVVLYLPLAALCVLGSRSLGANPDDPPPVVMLALGAFVGLFAVLGIACGVGLWMLRPWGRVLQIVRSAFGVLGFPLGTMFHGLILFYLFQDGTRVLFSGKPASALTPAEAQAIRAGGAGSAGAVAVVIGVVVALFVGVAMLGIIAAIAIPNFVNATGRSKLKRTMSDMRSIGTAVESYQVDNGAPPAVPSSADAAAALAPFLEPTFIRALPRLDGWQRPFGWTLEQTGTDAEGKPVFSYTITSLAKDGVPDTERPAPGATTGFDADIYFTDGQFAVYPEGTSR